ncbi:MAG: tRNA pseudouridine(38-40) synthase TruA [Bacteroidia bacterium]|nr:MAG: tRNA pseudouridine(38-40) synthase TruA [Bacteroidia bacterium]
MQRYFLELQYKGTHFAGFQKQPNAVTVQGCIEDALQLVTKKNIELTGSSRTDTGVHALQNFFHFDMDGEFHPRWIYNLNAILHADIVIKKVEAVHADAHCRFDAISRTYNYHIYQKKNPFLKETAFFYHYALDIHLLNEAAAILKTYTDFTSFSKRNTQVFTHNCNIIESEWFLEENLLIYKVTSNRFLRGMVRALVATMLKVGRGQTSIDEFKKIIEAKNNLLAKFDAPGHGLFLMKVNYP